MAGLDLSGNLMLMGNLNFEPGGKLTVDNKEVLIEGPAGAEGQGPPVLLPPPSPVTQPIDPGPKGVVMSSFNKTVKIDNAKIIVAGGVVAQGNNMTWPGMMQPSSGNTGPVTINGIPINVMGDKATIFPNGGMVTFAKSGQ